MNNVQLTPEEEAWYREYWEECSDKEAAKILHEKFGYIRNWWDLRDWRRRRGLEKPRGGNHWSRPVGSVSLWKQEGQRYRRIKTDLHKWEKEERVVWEKAYGPIPAGHLVCHINRDTQDNRLENLICLSRSQFIYITRCLGGLSADPEIRQTQLLMAELGCQISQKEKRKK